MDLRVAKWDSMGMGSSKKYFALHEFGFVVQANHPGPRKGRSYVVTNAGQDAVDAGGVGAITQSQGGSNRERDASRRRTAPARTAKPCGPGCRCYSQAFAEVH